MPNSVAAESLQVGIPIQGSEPYVIQQGAEFEGIIIDIWQEIAEQQQLDYEWVPQTNYSEAVEAVAQGELDIFVGPISINPERLEIVEFSQPFDEGQIALMVPEYAPSLWSRLKPFLGIAALTSVGVLVGSIFVVGNLIWWVERKHNPEHFPPHYVHGVGNGMWFALVTLTTVGYGDRAPSTPIGRFIAGVWMVLTLLAVSSITAGLASALTVSLSASPRQQFESAADLRGSQILATEGGTSAQWANYYLANVIERETLGMDEAAQSILQGQAEGFINHHQFLQYFLNQNPELPLTVTTFPIATELYGFALPLDSPLTHDINLVIVKMRQEGDIQALKDRWL